MKDNNFNKIEENINFTTEIGQSRIIKFLGKGKSGYSYLVEISGKNYVLKLMHNEVCPYYHFTGNKVELELKAFNELKLLSIRTPELIFSSIENNYLIKEFINGKTGSQAIAENEISESIFTTLLEIEKSARLNGLNIDYFPSNFIINGNELYYIDYEINPYSEQWNFTNWGIYYWLNIDGMKQFIDTGDSGFINADINNGIPHKKPFEKRRTELLRKIL